MSSANLDLVRSIYAAWARPDYSSAEWADPEIQCVIADGPEPGTWTGLTRMSQGARDFLSAWEEYRFEADEYRERVLVITRSSGRGKTSGVELVQMRAHLFHIREGRVTSS
jgi:ketosteroid isomerase-like protein